MKRILITGVNSYVGNSLEAWLAKEPDKYQVDKISLRDGLWKKRDFSNYDSIVHVAGIAHRKETKDNKHLYYEVNRDLAFEVAEKAKREGVSHFIFLSSMSVYGINEGVIDENTIPKPNSNYGRSKLEAEQLIRTLEDERFKVAILRPPMIYGKGCKGNYQKLAKLARNVPVFPDINNRRSMIYIDNLSEFIKIIIDNYEKGLFFPQNDEYVNTTDLAKLIANVHSKKLYVSKSIGIMLKPLIKYSNVVIKTFGSLVVDTRLSRLKDEDYCVVDFKRSIVLSEFKKK